MHIQTVVDQIDRLRGQILISSSYGTKLRLGGDGRYFKRAAGRISREFYSRDAASRTFEPLYPRNPYVLCYGLRASGILLGVVEPPQSRRMQFAVRHRWGRDHPWLIPSDGWQDTLQIL